jgi:hypothetical protein
VIKPFLKKIMGITDLEVQAELLEQQRVAEQAEIDRLTAERAAAEAAAAEAREAAALAQMSAKDRATKKGEPYIAVLETRVNSDNIRNGFFELDWNELFIQELKLYGYGAEGDTEEEIVDRWFRDIVYNMFAEEGLDTSRGAGYINVVPISKGKSEVS